MTNFMEIVKELLYNQKVKRLQHHRHNHKKQFWQIVVADTLSNAELFKK